MAVGRVCSASRPIRINFGTLTEHNLSNDGSSEQQNINLLMKKVLTFLSLSSEQVPNWKLDWWSSAVDLVNMLTTGSEEFASASRTRAIKDNWVGYVMKSFDHQHSARKQNIHRAHVQEGCQKIENDFVDRDSDVAERVLVKLEAGDLCIVSKVRLGLSTKSLSH
jgi:hypothetical protein